MAKRRLMETPRPAEADADFRTRLPKQLSGRVNQDTFDQYEALRDCLRDHNGELFRRGADALIKQLSREDRRDFDLLLQRIKRQRQL